MAPSTVSNQSGRFCGEAFNLNQQSGNITSVHVNLPRIWPISDFVRAHDHYLDSVSSVQAIVSPTPPGWDWQSSKR